MSIFCKCYCYLLSLYRVAGIVRGQNISMVSCQIQTASFAAWVAATYLASVVYKVTNSCFFEDHETAPPSTRKTKPKIAHLCSCEAPSASTYPSNSLFSPPYVNSSFFVPHMYLKICFMASQCAHLRLSEHWVTVDTANAISSHVLIAAYINNPTASW